MNGNGISGKAEVTEKLKSIIDCTMEKYGRIDSVLVHVGGPPKGDLLEIEDEDWDKANQMIIKPVIRIAKYCKIALICPKKKMVNEENRFANNLWKTKLIRVFRRRIWIEFVPKRQALSARPTTRISTPSSASAPLRIAAQHRSSLPQDLMTGIYQTSERRRTRKN